MGTDIHGVFQRYDIDSRQWLDIPSKYEQERHYQLFAALAGVRNGYGFAGLQTGEPIVPIAKPRGLPADFICIDGAHPLTDLTHMDPRCQSYYEPAGRLEVWMGDHDWSWLTGDEMLAWAETAPEVLRTGIISRELYEAWDGKSAPECYFGAIYGPAIVTVPDNAVAMAAQPDWSHVSCEWIISLRDELAYFFDEVARLQSEHGQIRFVFGFDS